MTGPAYVVVELATEHADQEGVLGRLASAARSSSGAVVAHAAAGRVACLEPGTIASGLMIARFASRSQATRCAREALLPMLTQALPRSAVPTVLVADGLPDAGIPEMMAIPTAASVPRPPRAPRNFHLLVRGTAWDQERLNAYRDVILPMHFERGGYYEAFAIEPGQVEAISGEWREQIFAISRWPTRAAAEDFWYSPRYQTEAIPLRLGAGRFTVHGLDAAD